MGKKKLTPAVVMIVIVDTVIVEGVEDTLITVEEIIKVDQEEETGVDMVIVEVVAIIAVDMVDQEDTAVVMIVIVVAVMVEVGKSSLINIFPRSKRTRSLSHTIYCLI